MKIKNLILRFFVNTDLQKDILFLKNVDILRELSILQLKKIRVHMYKKTYMQKEIIYKERQEAKLICIVKSGKIELNNNKNKQILQKRDLFGKKYLFNNNEVYPYTSIALEDSEIFLIHKDDIETLVEKDKSIGFKMFKHTLNMLYEREQNER